jgi:hypothetical protein
MCADGFQIFEKLTDVIISLNFLFASMFLANFKSLQGTVFRCSEVAILTMKTLTGNCL